MWHQKHRGTAMVYVIIAMPVMLGFAGLGVDVARFQLAKTEAQSAADAAARYAAKGLATSSTPLTTARANAKAVAAQAKVDGSAPTINDSDVVRGNWNSNNKTFSSNSNGTVVRVTVRQTINRAGAAPLFMSLFTSRTQQVTATAIARCAATTTTLNPPASGNLWLSGMPNNTTNKNFRNDNEDVWDNSGTSGNAKQRPLTVSLSSLGLSAGDTISIEGISGTASWNDGSAESTNSADGDGGYLVANGVAPAGSVPSNSNNGMSNTRAPIGAVMGVFLGNSAPNGSGAPSCLDFGSETARDYTSVSPQLKQVFFIGDGKRSNGESQTITIPTGATRLFLGMMDAWQWNDNVGNFETKLYGDYAVTLLK